MYKKITKSLLVAMSVLALSGCAKTQTQEADMPTIASASDVTKFEGNSESKYYLKTSAMDAAADITSYVASTDQYRLTVKSDLLTDILGFTSYDRADTTTSDNTQTEVDEASQSVENLKIPTFKEFESSDGKLLQCEVDGNSLIYDGSVFTASQTITEDGQGNLTIPLSDLAFAIGYGRVDTSRDENSLTVSLVDADEMVYVNQTDDGTEGASDEDTKDTEAESMSENATEDTVAEIE